MTDIESFVDKVVGYSCIKRAVKNGLRRKGRIHKRFEELDKALEWKGNNLTLAVCIHNRNEESPPPSPKDIAKKDKGVNPSDFTDDETAFDDCSIILSNTPEDLDFSPRQRAQCRGLLGTVSLSSEPSLRSVASRRDQCARIQSLRETPLDSVITEIRVCTCKTENGDSTSAAIVAGQVAGFGVALAGVIAVYPVGLSLMMAG